MSIDKTPTGAASIIISLSDEVITVEHGSEPGYILGKKTNAIPGDWDKIIAALVSIGIEWQV